MRNPLSNLFHSRDKPHPSNAVSQAVTFYFGGSTAGKHVNPRSAMQTTTVYACVRVIAETIASLPLHIYEQTDQGREKAYGHPLYRMLHDEPNGEMTSFTWQETLIAHLLLWGNGYSQIIRDGRGRVVALYPLLPERMLVDRDSRGRLVYAYNKDSADVPLRPEDVLHIPGLGFDGVMGYSPIALERNAIGLGIAAEEYGSRFFANGATPSGVLTHPGAVKDTTRLRESWNAAYGGSGNSGKVAILEEGMKFEKVSIPNNEAQFLESRKFQVNEICRIYRVPPHMVGDLEHATFSNIEHESINFGVYTIRPWLIRLEQAMNKALFSESDKGAFFVSFNLDGLLRGDYKSRMEGYAIGRQNGWMSANDIRDLESMNPIPAEQGGDDYLVNGNMVKLKTRTEVMPVRRLSLNGYIDDEAWLGDEITPGFLHTALYGEDGQSADDVQILLNSYGGSCGAAVRMYDDVCAYPGKVTMIISGTAASAATVLAMAADELEMTPGSLYMIHDPSVVAWGNERDLRDAIHLLTACKDSILNVYARRCKLPREKLAQQDDEDDYLTGLIAMAQSAAEDFCKTVFISPAPEAVRLAILLFVGHYYEFRDSSDKHAYLAMRMAFEALLWPHRDITKLF